MPPVPSPWGNDPFLLHHHQHHHQHQQSDDDHDFPGDAIKQKRQQPTEAISLEAMIQRNLSSDALRPLINYRHTLSLSPEPADQHQSQSPSNGPDSPYSRLSRNLSQLLDEEDAHMDAKLLSSLGNRGGVRGRLDSPPVFHPSLIHHADATSKVGLTSSPRTVTVLIQTTEEGGWGEQEFEEMMSLLVACGHQVLSFVAISPDKVMLEFGRSEEAVQVQSLVDGYVLRCSARTMKALHHNGGSKAPSASGKAAKAAVSRSIWVGHVGQEISDDMLKRAFEVHGPVELVRRVEGRGCAFVNFCQVEHAVIARKALNNSRLGSGIIKTGFAKSATGSPTELTTGEVIPSQLDSPRTISYTPPTTTEGSFDHPIPALPDVPVQLDGLKEIRIELEHQATDYVDSIYCRFREHMATLSLDAMGNIVVQKLLERGDLQRRLDICELLSPHLAALSCHKNGTWVVQKFISLASNSGDSRDLRHLLMSSLQPHLVALLKDQFGNYVVQGCLGLGQCARVLLECVAAGGVELAKTRFGARAMKSLLEPTSSRHYDQRYCEAIIEPLRENVVELMANPHGALLLSFLLSCGQVCGGDLILVALPAIHTLLLNRHAVTVLQEASAAAQPATLSQLTCALTTHDNPLRLLGDQGAVSLICACISSPTLDAGARRELAARFGPLVARATVHSEQHADNLAKITMSSRTLSTPATSSSSSSATPSTSSSATSS